MPRKQSLTAADLMAELAKDPEYQQKIREKEQQRKNLAKLLEEDESGLVAECNAVGVRIESVWDLVNTTSSYTAAIPILLKHLEKEHHLRTQEGIIRALTTPESQGNAGIFIRMFLIESDSESQMKWLIGAAIAESAVGSDANKIIELANDESHGKGREFLPLGLMHAAKDKALLALNSWKNDPVLGENSLKLIKLWDSKRPG